METLRSNEKPGNGAKPAAVPRDPQAAAAFADLTYVNDAEPGIRRRRAGKGFYYLDPDGRRVGDPETLERIRSLAIPPAWNDVWICADPGGHIQATGRDSRGRKQYRYHPSWFTCRDEVKFSSLIGFAEALPKLRETIEADLSSRGLSRERVIASIIWLLDRTMIRIGNDLYRRENKSFGLTTLHSRHVAVQGSQLRFRFTGKSGMKWHLSLNDRRIARIVKTIQELPGQNLFQYRSDDGEYRTIQSHDVNDYIHVVAGNEFSSKHFRTWGATVEAAIRFGETAPPETVSARNQERNRVIDSVAKRLRNTRAVCRKCYIHPAVIAAWDEGRLGDELADLRRRTPKPLKGLDQEESLVLRWLRQTASI